LDRHDFFPRSLKKIDSKFNEVLIISDIAMDRYCVKKLYGVYGDTGKNHNLEDKSLFYPQRGFGLLEVHLIMKITNIKSQISNNFQ